MGDIFRSKRAVWEGTSKIPKIPVLIILIGRPGKKLELGNQVAGKVKDLEGNSYFFLYKSNILEGKFYILDGKLDFGCREALHFSSTAYRHTKTPQFRNAKRG